MLLLHKYAPEVLKFILNIIDCIEYSFVSPLLSTRGGQMASKNFSEAFNQYLQFAMYIAINNWNN